MPIDFLGSVFLDGTDIPYWEQIKTYGPAVTLLAGIKWYMGGNNNIWDRDLHGKVYMVTGGTSGLGARTTFEMAQKGAQILMLVRSTEDQWLVDYIEDMREKTNNPLIYAEECDLASLHSVRLFATKWLDNSPPRRLDGVVCCAGELIPRGKPRQITIDGVERQIAINYLAHFHLLTLLAPSFKVQPADRDVRVVITTCSSQAMAQIDFKDLLWSERQYPKGNPLKVYGTSKLMLGLFAKSYQRQLNVYERKDKNPVNVKISIVNPGLMRTQSMRRFISMGSLLGLICYMILWPLWFIIFKSPFQGAQSVLFALYAPIFAKGDGGNLVQECRILKEGSRREYQSEEFQDELFTKTEQLITTLEKQLAIERKKQELKQNKDDKNKNNKKKTTESKEKHYINEKPKTVGELDSRINELRNLIGMGQQLSSKELPLFPDQTVDSIVGKASNPTKRKGKKV
ncbi:uncharacterized protein KQ657_005153 [Scheffersomyces spartinae]|uniref:Oxidoreductase n=1 Tax=Scheffersomyces spartinae TaxID=45513 RepID=A0A9P7V9S9_9ASCO|nr:uncharacterized protein KQ657_005153 [Scheffersomyces spartinae]KAG7193954.1 hypothetical protein KQ657_005153 [Scheffersomyces spartinae]